MCGFPNNPSTHIPVPHTQGTAACTPLRVQFPMCSPGPRQSKFLQEGTALLVFLPRTSQGGRAALEAARATSTYLCQPSITEPLRYVPYPLVVVFHLKALPILKQGKNIRGPAVAQGAAHSSSRVPHRALKRNNHIAAPITHLRSGARSPTETTSHAQEPMRSLSPSSDLPPPLGTLAVTPPNSSSFLCALCNLRRKAPLHGPEPSYAWA